MTEEQDSSRITNHLSVQSKRQAWHASVRWAERKEAKTWLLSFRSALLLHRSLNTHSAAREREKKRLVTIHGTSSSLSSKTLERKSRTHQSTPRRSRLSSTSLRLDHRISESETSFHRHPRWKMNTTFTETRSSSLNAMHVHYLHIVSSLVCWLNWLNGWQTRFVHLAMIPRKEMLLFKAICSVGNSFIEHRLSVGIKPVICPLSGDVFLPNLIVFHLVRSSTCVRE